MNKPFGVATMLSVAAAVLVFMAHGTKATVGPVQMDPPVSEPVLLVGEAYRVAPVLHSVEIVNSNEPATEPVAASLIAELCGDSDGCQIRFVIYDLGMDRPDTVAGGHLLTDPTATQFAFVAFDGTRVTGDTSVMAGTTVAQTDAFYHPILCSLQASSFSGFNFYYLEINPGDTSSVSCRLRIED